MQVPWRASRKRQLIRNYNAQRSGCGRRDGMNSSAPAVLKTTCALAIWRDTESPRDTDLPEPCHRCGDKLGEADAQSPLIP
jgi:hypothetical protein